VAPMDPALAPAAHDVQVELPDPEYDPVPQRVQAVAPLEPAYDPAGHGVQLPDEIKYDPGPHDGDDTSFQQPISNGASETRL
jgi:hypothetical protein